MPDNIKPAVRSEGDGTTPRHNENQESDVTGVFDRFNPGAVPPDNGGPAEDLSVEAPSRGAPSPSVEADAEDDPQSPGTVAED